MQKLAGDQLDDEMLKNLWLQRLPVQVETILTTGIDSLNNLSKMVDKIHEVSEISTVAAVNMEKQCKCQTSNSYSALELQVILLIKAIEGVVAMRGESTGRSKEQGPSFMTKKKGKTSYVIIMPSSRHKGESVKVLGA